MDESQSFLQLSYWNESLYKMSRGLVDWMKVNYHLETYPFIKWIEDWMKVKFFFSSHLEIYLFLKWVEDWWIGWKWSFLKVSYVNMSLYKMSRGLVDWMKVKAFVSSHLEINPFIKWVEDWMKVTAFFSSHLKMYRFIKWVEDRWIGWKLKLLLILIWKYTPL